MINMKRIGRTHILCLDTSTDKSHMFARDDFGKKNPILTFDSSLNCTDAKGKVVARITSCHNNWITNNDLGIVTTPVSMNEMEGVFDVEAEFCQKWFELQTVVA